MGVEFQFSPDEELEGGNSLRLVKNFLWNVGYQLFIIIIPLITIPYVTRVLGPTGVGVNAYTNSIVQYFALIAGLGINIYGTREVAYTRNNRKLLSNTFWSLVFLRFITTLIVVFFYVLFIFKTSQYQIYYWAQIFVLLSIGFDISWFFQGIEEFRITVLRNTLVKLFSLVLIFVFVKTKSDTLLYVIILSMSQLFGFMTLWPYLRNRIDAPWKCSINIWAKLKPSIILLIPQIATQVYLQLNKTMLGIYDGVASAGFYDNSDKIIKMLLAIVTATGTVMLPYVSNSFSKGDKEAVNRALSISMHIILVLAIPLAFGISSVSSAFTQVFFGPGFSEVGKLMSIESVVVILIGISNAIGVQYLLPTQQTSEYTISVIGGSILNVVLNFPLIYFFNTIGAVISTVISELFVTVYQLKVVRNQVDVGALFKESGKYFCAALGMFVCVRLISQHLMISISALLIESLAGVAIYSIVLFALRPQILIGYIKSMRKRRE